MKNKINTSKCFFFFFFFNLPQGPSFLSEAVFPQHAIKIEEMDPFFNLHETITKVGEKGYMDLWTGWGKLYFVVGLLAFYHECGKENNQPKVMYVFASVKYTRKNFGNPISKE